MPSYSTSHVLKSNKSTSKGDNTSGIFLLSTSYRCSYRKEFVPRGSKFFLLQKAQSFDDADKEATQGLLT